MSSKLSHVAHEKLESLLNSSDSSRIADVSSMLNDMPPADVAHLIESSTPKLRQLLWQLVDTELEGEVIGELSEDLQSQFLAEMDASEVAVMTEGMADDDIAYILQQLPGVVTQEVLASMDQQDRARIERVLPYAEDTAGGLMTTDAITIRARVTLDVVLRYLRRHSEIPPMTDNLIVVNNQDQYIGLLPLRTLLVSDPSASVREMMVTDVNAIPAEMTDTEVARLFERNDWVSAPVIDTEGKLLGRITIDDVVDVIREDADHSFMSMAGLDEEQDTFAPVFKTAPRRALWLGINLITAFIAAGVINLFQDTIEKVVAIAVLMPIVASMGGIAGTQTLTVLVRGMAVGQISRNNQSWLVNRELAVGVLNGLLWATVVGIVASVWFNDWTLSLVIAIAIVINLITASLVGALLPLFLNRIGIDPALAGGVILTTVTDVVGFLSFLGLAAFFYG